jgi:hypothetical protein
VRFLVGATFGIAAVTSEVRGDASAEAASEVF